MQPPRDLGFLELAAQIDPAARLRRLALRRGELAIHLDDQVVETVQVEVDALKPALVRSTEVEDFLYLLMPVRVS